MIFFIREWLSQELLLWACKISPDRPNVAACAAAYFRWRIMVDSGELPDGMVLAILHPDHAARLKGYSNIFAAKMERKST